MQKVIVTGALGYSGKVITEGLFRKGLSVKTLTNSLHKENPFGSKLEIAPLNFKSKSSLTSSMESYDTLINTYWVRFNHKTFNHNAAVENTKTLFDAAAQSGIKRIVHVSITNPDLNSELEYFRGKAELEEYLKKTGLSYSIVRPAVLFGRNDILINNIAWFIRHLPLFGIFGKGDYKLQPIHIEDFANVCINEAASLENRVINAIGPETFTYKGLVQTMMSIMNCKKPIISVSTLFGFWAGKVISTIKNDVTITKEEIKGLMDNLLYVNDSPAGKIKLTDYLEANKNAIGHEYANELKRRK